MTIAHSLNGTAIHGVEAAWERVRKRRGVDGAITWQPYARLIWTIPQMEMATFDTIRALQGQAVSSLITAGFAARNTQTEYTTGEITSAVNGGQIGRRAVNVRLEFRVDV